MNKCIIAQLNRKKSSIFKVIETEYYVQMMILTKIKEVRISNWKE